MVEKVNDPEAIIKMYNEYDVNPEKVNAGDFYDSVTGEAYD